MSDKYVPQKSLYVTYKSRQELMVLMVLMVLITSVVGLITTAAELISAVISRRDSWQGNCIVNRNTSCSNACTSFQASSSIKAKYPNLTDSNLLLAV